MALRLYNTLTRAKEAFEPLDPGHVRMYVCGPTVYDFAHIGNARPVVVFDVLARLLKSRFPKVTYVRNITDVDDKINARAAESGRTIREITEETAAQFHADMAALMALPPDVEPRATEHVAEMIEMIKTLIDKKHAYPKNGHVFFRVSSMADYGQLSGRNPEDLLTGARDDLSGFDVKENPGDFVLWKPSDEKTPGWKSPWDISGHGGRPGWHIECSAMSAKHLCEGYDDKTFDIHGGGVDLVFPHHENEIAQSRCAHGSGMMARVWMHNGFLMSEGEKMSKSLGNFYTVNELLREFPGEAVRLVLLKSHYRQPLNFTKSGVAEAKRELDGFYQALRDLPFERLSALKAERNRGLVEDALADDLNTPEALHFLHIAVRSINKSPGPAKESLQVSLRQDARVLGLLQQDPEDWFKWRPPAQASSGGLPDDAVDALVAERQEARKSRNFALADEIRDELSAAGVVLEDGAGGTIWRRG